jgi:hypothetical protein
MNKYKIEVIVESDMIEDAEEIADYLGGAAVDEAQEQGMDCKIKVMSPVKIEY